MTEEDRHKLLKSTSTQETIGLNDSLPSYEDKSKKMQRTKSGVITVKVKQFKTKKPHLSKLFQEEFETQKSSRGLSSSEGSKRTLRSRKSGRPSATLRMDREGSIATHNNELDSVEIVEDDGGGKENAALDSMKALAMLRKMEKEAHDFPFNGKWESTEVELDTFMSELKLSNKFSKLAMTHGGDVKQSIRIKQFGENADHFVITEDNERRKIKYAVNIGEDFMSSNELDEDLECKSRWAESCGREEFIIEEKNTVTGEVTVIRRKVDVERGELRETKKIGDKPEVSRIYTRADI